MVRVNTQRTIVPTRILLWSDLARGLRTPALETPVVSAATLLRQTAPILGNAEMNDARHLPSRRGSSPPARPNAKRSGAVTNLVGILM